jgi:hypothetical protein
MPESSSLTLIVTDESPRIKSQAVRCKAAPSVATSFYIGSDEECREQPVLA